MRDLVGRRKITCSDCFFGCNELCALGLGEPCPTFRANLPEGLMPPSQLALLLRDDPGEAESSRVEWAHADHGPGQVAVLG